MARGDPANTSPKPSEKDGDEKRNEDDEQSARFMETARQLAVDETGEKFEKVARSIFRGKPKKNH
jgi:hypothetical protein